MRRIVATAMGLAMTAELMTGCSAGGDSSVVAPSTSIEQPSDVSSTTTTTTAEIPPEAVPLTPEQSQRRQQLLDELDYEIECYRAEGDEDITFARPTGHDFKDNNESVTIGLAFEDQVVAGMSVRYTAGEQERVAIDVFGHSLRDESDSQSREFLTAEGSQFVFGEEMYITELFPPLRTATNKYMTYVSINRLRDGELSVNAFCTTEPVSLSDLEGTPS